MSSFFLDRSKRADGWLEWKVRLFAVAAVLALCGIYFEERWMTLVAVVVLLAALLPRLVGRGGRPTEPEEGASEDEGASEHDTDG